MTEHIKARSSLNRGSKAAGIEDELELVAQLELDDDLEDVEELDEHELDDELEPATTLELDDELELDAI